MTAEQVKTNRKARQAAKKQKRHNQDHSADFLSQTIDNLTAKIARMIDARDAKRDLDEVTKYSSILRNLTATVYVAKIATELENISDVLDAQLLMSKDIIKAIRKTGG